VLDNKLGSGLKFRSWTVDILDSPVRGLPLALGHPTRNIAALRIVELDERILPKQLVFLLALGIPVAPR
jgi:hypothetical protein